MHRLLLFFLIFQAANLSAQLNGTYTIGGTDPSFTNFTTASAALSTQGISGNVNFNVRPGTYAERFILGPIIGSGPSRTVTFQAENGDSSSVILVNPTATGSTNYIIKLSASYVVLKNLSFQTPAAGTYSLGIAIYSASNVRLENCQMTGSLNTSTQNANDRSLFIVSGACPNLTIRNCFFKYGQFGVAVFGGETSASPDMLIEKNRFFGTIGEAVMTSFTHRIKIQQNLVDSCALGFSIASCSTAMVQNNRIFTHYYGCLRLSNCIGTSANRTLVANNMMAIYGTETQISGVIIQGSDYIDFFHNSLNIQAGTQQIYGVVLSGSRYIRIQNNSIVVKQGGTPVVLSNEPNEIEAFSHCNLYNGLIVNDLPPNSISANPYYKSLKDLHVNNAVLNNLGAPSPTVPTDIDGENRSPQTPDIGADEYTPIQLSAGVMDFVNPSADSIYCAELPLEVVLRNTGLETLTSVVLTVTLNGVAQPAVSWNGSLASGESTRVSLGLLALVPAQANTVMVQSSVPNGTNDQFSQDDQLVFSNLFSALSGTYTLGGANPDFSSFSTAVNALQRGGLCGSTTLLVRDGIYNEQIQINALKGSSPQSWLTFLGESGDSSKVILTAPGSNTSNATLRMQQCRFMKLKSLTIQQTANSNDYTPLFIILGTDITLENCIFDGYYDFFGSYASEAALVAFPDSNLTVRNCVIGGASAGARLIGVGPRKYNLIFENNEVYSGDDDCLNLQQWQNVRVRDNYFAAGSQYSLYGIYGLNLYNYDISNNRVSIGGVQATVGIYLINCAEYNDDISLVSNNVISMNLSEDIFAFSRGMWIINCDSIHIIHNTIRHNSPDQDNRAFEIRQTRSAYVVNNVFVNTGLGLAIEGSGDPDSYFDYNVYFTNGDFLAPGSSDLSGIQAQTGGDQHSIVANPGWTNGAPDSLSLRNPMLENIGTQTEVLTDIFGFPRQFPNPDPGAFETPTAPIVQLGPDQIACGQTILHGFTPGATTYLWNTGATTADLLVTTSGEYILTASNALGTSTDTILVTILPPPMVNAGPDISVCQGDPFVIQSSGSEFCVWQELNGNFSASGCSLALISDTSRTYVLTGIDSSGCQTVDTVKVNVHPYPIKPIIEEQAGVLSVVSSDAVQWYVEGLSIEGANSTTYVPTASGRYVVQATNSAGCSTDSESYFFTVSGTAELPDNMLTIFPNPVAGKDLFARVAGDFQPERFAIFDAQGRMLNSGPVSIENAGIYTIPVHLEKGFYFLKMWGKEGAVVLKKLEVF